MPIISLASSFRRYFGFFSPPKRFVLKWWSNLDDGQRPGQAEIFRSATLAGDGGISGCNFDGEETSIWEVDITTIEAIHSNGEKGENRVWGWKLALIGKQKFLLGWFCMFCVQMINLAKKEKSGWEWPGFSICAMFSLFPTFPKKLQWKWIRPS